MAKYICEECGLQFEAIEALGEHAIRHSGDSTADPNHTNDDAADDRESTLLKQTEQEEKARKRTRGPYRKSAAA
jgi:hypothetical protein